MPEYHRWFESYYNIYNEPTIKHLSNQEIAEINKLLDKNVNLIKGLVKKMGDLSKVTLEQRNFFLYDESNYINHTFYTELNKKNSNIWHDINQWHRTKNNRINNLSQQPEIQCVGKETQRKKCLATRIYLK